MEQFSTANTTSSSVVSIPNYWENEQSITRFQALFPADLYLPPDFDTTPDFCEICLPDSWTAIGSTDSCNIYDANKLLRATLSPTSGSSSRLSIIESRYLALFLDELPNCSDSPLQQLSRRPIIFDLGKQAIVRHLNAVEYGINQDDGSLAVRIGKLVYSGLATDDYGDPALETGLLPFHPITFGEFLSRSQRGYPDFFIETVRKTGLKAANLELCKHEISCKFKDLTTWECMHFDLSPSGL